MSIGMLIGQFFPQFETELKVLGDVFVKMIKMVIAPILFFTIVTGIAKSEKEFNQSKYQEALTSMNSNTNGIGAYYCNAEKSASSRGALFCL